MPNLRRVLPAIILAAGLIIGIAGAAFAGPNAAVVITATADKTTGVRAGDLVTVTFAATGLVSANGFVAELIYDSTVVRDSTSSSLMAGAISPGKQVDTLVVKVAGYNRRVFTGAALLGGSPVSGNSNMATLGVTLRSGATAANLAVRQFIVRAAAGNDTIVMSPIKVLQINPPAPAVDLSPATVSRNFNQTQVLTAKYNGAAGDTITWTASGTTAGGNIRITAVGGDTITPQPRLPFNLTAAPITFRTVTNAALLGNSTLTLAATGTGRMTATIITAATSGGVTTRDTSLVVFDVPVPAELSAFNGVFADGKVQLDWTTVSQTNNAGWRVLRSTDNEHFEPVSGLVSGAGTSNERLDYRYSDVNLPKDKDRLYYVLEQVDLDGKVTRSKVTEVLLGGRFADTPKEFSTALYPNPFNPATTIAYNLPEAAKVSIIIYDALGQQVRTLVGNAETAAGRYSIQWDARDNSGRQVASGVYFAQITAGKFNGKQKMLLLK
jgi:hypothetical protein